VIQKIDSNKFSLTILKVTTFSRIRHRKEKNNAKLLKITVRYKMQTCDFIINDKFFYGIFKSKICKK